MTLPYFKKHKSDVWVTQRLGDGTMGEVLKHKVPNYATNYRNYIAKQSTGSLRIGLQTLNESIESYCYSVLGAQA